MNNRLIRRNIILFIIMIIISSNFVSADSFKDNIKIGISEKFNSLGNQPPETPDINGPTIGKPQVELEYTICSTDPEGNNVVYCFDWGDDSGEVCIGPYSSGEIVTISHTWIENGTFTITVKAADIHGDESGIATLKVRISTSRSCSYSRDVIIDFLRFLNLLNDKKFFLFSIF